ncbi:MAG: hypothetical protein MZV49_17410 [Rhodopseudomonas palustris]|nr:hypothetical protein [Rhodopseudomonas palustris]
MSCALSPASKVQPRAQPVQARAGGAGAAAEDHRAGRAVELGDRHHDGALDRQQAARRSAPHCSSVWNSTGCAGEVGHVEPRQRSPRPRWASL